MAVNKTRQENCSLAIFVNGVWAWGMSSEILVSTIVNFRSGRLDFTDRADL